MLLWGNKILMLRNLGMSSNWFYERYIGWCLCDLDWAKETSRCLCGLGWMEKGSGYRTEEGGAVEE